MERVALLFAVYEEILGALASHIRGVALPLPKVHEVGSLASLKKYEDALDALVCAWSGMCFLEGTAHAYGDATAAVWIP